MNKRKPFPAPAGYEDDFNAVAYRALRDAWTEATAAYWRRRAEQLEAARPRRGDFHGQSTRADLVARYEELTAAATACRNRAAYLEASHAQFDDTLSTLARGAAA